MRRGLKHQGAASECSTSHQCATADGGGALIDGGICGPATVAAAVQVASQDRVGLAPVASAVSAAVQRIRISAVMMDGVRPAGQSHELQAQGLKRRQGSLV